MESFNTITAIELTSTSASFFVILHMPQVLCFNHPYQLNYNGIIVYRNKLFLSFVTMTLLYDVDTTKPYPHHLISYTESPVTWKNDSSITCLVLNPKYLVFHKGDQLLLSWHINCKSSSLSHASVKLLYYMSCP